MRQSKNKTALKKRVRKMDRMGNRCYICNRKMQPFNPTKKNGFTMDHVVAKAKNGINKKPACRECNERKAAMDLITLKRGTMVRFGDIPFRLATDTYVFGEKINLPENKEAS